VRFKHLDKKGLRSIKSGTFKDFLYERDSALLEDGSTEDKEIRARIKIQKAILWININRGFFGQLLANLNIYGSSDPKYPTMCTNGLNIQYHPDFVLSQSDAAIRFVLCHEILHCVGDHMGRRGNRPMGLWNTACDYAINPILDAEKDSNFAWPKNPDGTRMGLYEEKYAGMRAEDIYDDILKDQKKMQELEQMGPEENFGAVTDADQDLSAPDSEQSIAQETFGDEEEDTTQQQQTQPQPGEGEDEKGEEGDQKKPGGEGGEQGEDAEGDQDSTSQLVGKKARITEGPDKGKIGTITKVLPNGDVIIE
jgi:hypothetical protein